MARSCLVILNLCVRVCSGHSKVFVLTCSLVVQRDTVLK